MNDYSIVRNPIPIINQVLLTMLAGNAVFALSIVLLGIIRRSLEIDATFAVTGWIFFLLQAFLVSFYVGKLLSVWLRTSYVVLSNRLVISTGKGFSSDVKSSPDLKMIRGVEVNQNRTGRRYNYGDVIVKFDVSHSPKPVVLKDVSNPKNVAAQLSSVKK